MKKVFVINGEAQAGKDTFVELVTDILGKEKVWNYSSVDKVKEIARACGWDGVKTPEARKFLSDLKDLTESFNQMPYRSMADKIQAFWADESVELLFLHVREPEQIKQLQDEFGVSTILIKRNGHITNASNHADARVYEYTYDYVLKNPGTNLEEYRILAEDWVDCICYMDQDR